MKKLILLLSIIGLIFTVACKKKDANSSVESKLEIKTPKEELALMIFSKSSCYGKCPTYTATITPEGVVDFNSRGNTPVIGIHTLQAREGFVDEVMERANNIKFYDLQDKYDSEYVTDIPSTTLKIETTERSKSVYSRYKSPEEVKEFYNFIHDELMLLAEVKNKVEEEEKLNNKEGKTMPTEIRKVKNPYPIPKDKN